jgi:hypothetical protein
VASDSRTVDRARSPHISESPAAKAEAEAYRQPTMRPKYYYFYIS